MTLNNQGIPSFGKAIFKKPPTGFRGAALKRIIFQYSATSFMSLGYNKDKNMLQFDHLAPIDEDLVGQYQYYAPSFQVDGLKWQPNGFEFVEAIDARNPAADIDKDYHPEGEDFQKNKKAIYTPH
jgi:hypothetical protein